MRNKTNTILIFCSLFIGSSCFAYINKQKINESFIYCPSKVICSKENDEKSCKAVGDKLEYWEDEYIGVEGRVAKGEYLLKEIRSKYQAQRFDHTAPTCRYNNFDSGFEKLLALWSKENSDFEPFYDKSTSWNIIGYDASCLSKDTLKCPLEIKNSFKINLAPPSGKVGFIISSNGTVILKYPYWSSSTISVIYDDVLSACGSVKQCKINIDLIVDHDEHHAVKAGNFVVDMTNKMNIIQINPEGNYQISKHPIFNTIVINKSSLYKHK